MKVISFNYLLRAYIRTFKVMRLQKAKSLTFVLFEMLKAHGKNYIKIIFGITVYSCSFFFECVQTCIVWVQSQKTQGFCVADFATLSDERRSRSKILPLFIWIKEACVRKFEGLERSKLLGISQTKYAQSTVMRRR